MKKFFSLILSVVVAVVFLAGCGAAPADTAATTAAATTAATTAATEATTAAPDTAAGDTVKTGFAVLSSIAKSTEPADTDGLAEVDSTVAAVAVDKDGKIVKCIIDSVQSKINFSKAGKLTTDLKTVFESKQVLGEAYGMKKASGIGKEWNEEATAFANYVVGKTVEEVKGIAVNDKGTAGDAELAASVTVHIGDFITVVEKAVANARDNGAKASDKMGLGIQTTISNSKDAGENDGVAQAYSNYALTTFDASGKITSCVIDASQSNVNFSAAGKITSDLKAEIKTKNELGDAYGMKKASGIGKEWNEEAAAFAAYAVGKTVDEVKGIAINDKGAPTDAELASSVTVHITDFTASIEKAATSAK